jgi:hypothetical protein
VGLEPARSAADVPDAGAEARGTDRLAEQVQYRPLGGHPVQGVSQPAGVEFGEDVTRAALSSSVFASMAEPFVAFGRL